MRLDWSQPLSLAYLVTAPIGAAIAVRENLPAAFLGIRTGWSARDDFLVGTGTALSPPLCMLAIQGMATALSMQPGRAGQRGLTALALLGAAETIGILGEPTTYGILVHRRRTPRKAALVLALTVLPMLLAAASVRRLRREAAEYET